LRKKSIKSKPVIAKAYERMSGVRGAKEKTVRRELPSIENLVSKGPTEK